VWVDGTSLNYTNWESGQPNGGSAENCLLMENGYKWHDYPCDSLSAFFCKIDDPAAPSSHTSTTSNQSGGGGGGGFHPAPVASLITASSASSVRSLASSSTSRGKATMFTDVFTGDWFYPFVNALVSKGVVSGYKNTHNFGPADPVTYGQLAKMIIVLMHRNPIGTQVTFNWAEPYVRAARSEGLNIYMNDKLNLNQPATRGAVIHTILQAYGITLSAAPQSKFSDLPMNHPYAKDILTAVTLGIISGDANKNTIRPDAPINRAEVTKILEGVSEKFTPAEKKAVSSSTVVQSSSSISSKETLKPAAGKDIRTVTSSILHVRADSRIDSTLLWTAHKGIQMEVLEIVHNDWAHIRMPDGAEGYVWVHYLSK
jgi:hypothetical protein